MKKTALIIMLITISSKVFGFVRDIMLSYFYGASNISDVYLISITIPMVIFSFIGTGILTGYIPMYSKIERNQGEAEANRFTNNLINILLALCSVLIIFGLLFTDQIVKVFASGFSGDTLILAVQFTRIALLGIYFSGIIYIFSGFLQLKGNYFVPALIGFPFNFFIILSIIISSNTSIFVLSVGSVIAVAAQLILMLPFIYKKGYRHKLVFDIHDKNIKNMTYIALPVIFGMKSISISFIKILCASLVMGLMAKLSYNYLTTIISPTLSLLISIGIGVAVYFATIYLMKIEDADIIISIIKRKMRRNITG